jgi:predicted ATPase/AraC-like DNA-binding protein
MLKFFGRKSEHAKLTEIFSRVRTGGSGRAMIYGPPGVGKSALVHRFALAVDAAGGTFVFGKAAMHRLTTPFGAVSAALDMLVKQRMAESPENAPYLAGAVAARLGPDLGKALALSPALSFLMEDAAVSEPPETARQGLSAHSLIYNLLELFADSRKGLVLFLDDLQWLDAAAMKLLTHLAVAPPIPGLFLVMGFRGPEYVAESGIPDLLKTFRETDDCLVMELKGLPRRDIAALIRNRLGIRQDVKPLADLCYAKTHGNPLYLTRLLHDLVTGGAVCETDGEWLYDLERIRGMAASENVIDFIVARIRTLPDKTLLLLKYGALMQGELRPRVLAGCTGLSPEKIAALLWEPLQLELLERSGGCYRFLHDRIQEAVSDLIPESERPEMHAGLMDWYLEAVRKASDEEDLFALLFHFERAGFSSVSPETAMEISRHYFAAGRLAWRQSAYGQALRWYARGKRIYPGDLWAEDAARAYDFCRYGAECAYQAGEFDTADGFFKEAAFHLPDPVARFDMEMVKISCCLVRNDLKTALNTGLALLEHLGVRLSRHPSNGTLFRVVLRAWGRFLVGRPGTEEGRETVRRRSSSRILQVFVALGPIATLLSMEKLIILLGAGAFEYSLKERSVQETPLCYMAFGVILNRITASAAWGRRLAAVARDFRGRYPDESLRGKELYIRVSFLAHWDMSLPEIITAYEAGRRICLKQGDHEYYAYHTLCALSCRLPGDETLAEVLEEARRQRATMRRINSFFGISMLTRLIRTLECLCTGREAPGPGEDRGALQGGGTPENRPNATLLLYRFYEAFFSGRTNAAHDLKEAMAGVAEHEFVFDYFRFLATLVEIDAGKSRKKARRHLKQLKRYAGENPGIFRGRYLLASGEFHRVWGTPARARMLYQEAEAILAGEKGGKFEKAYLLEKSASVLETLGDATGAGEARSRAIAGYRQWGLNRREGLFEAVLNVTAPENTSYQAEKAFVSPGKAVPAEVLSPEASALLTIAEETGAEAVHAVVREAMFWKSVLYTEAGRIHRPATFPQLPGKMLTFAGITGRTIYATARDAEEQFFDTAYFFSHRPRGLVVVPGSRWTAILVVNPERTDEAALALKKSPVFDWLEKKVPESERPPVKAGPLVELCRRLQVHMREKRSYRNSKLTRERLASTLKIPPRAVTDALNICLGQNVQTFINSYRIEDVKAAMARPENADTSLLSLAFPAGFNSKTAFNNAFKKHTGMSPSAYRTRYNIIIETTDR